MSNYDRDRNKIKPDKQRNSVGENKCNLHPSNYSSTESGNTKEVYLSFIDNTEA